jgi:glycoside/pentoside/hexuronide:cation symporter, GPH family
VLGKADSWTITLAYGAAHFGKSLFWYSSELLFAFFLTEFAGLAPSQMGMVLVSGFLVSAVIDLAVGLTLQRRLQDAITAGRLQVIGAVLSSVALAAIFLVAWVPAEQRFAMAVALGIAFRLAFATYDIPQNALMSLATIDRDTRLRVASTRIWFSGAATLLVAASVGPMVAQTGGASGPWFLLMLSLGFSCVGIGAAAVLSSQLAFGDSAPAAEPAMPVARWQPSLVFWLLVAVSAITTCFTPAFAKLEAYFAAYTLQSAWWGGLIIIAMALGIVIGQPLWVTLARTHSSARVMALAAMVQIAGLAAFWLAGGAIAAVSAIAAFFFGLGNGGVGTVQWHAFSDVVAREAPRRAGLAYGIFAAVGKLGLATGATIIAVALESGEYRDPANPLVLNLMTLLPACGALALMLVAGAMISRTSVERGIRG